VVKVSGFPGSNGQDFFHPRGIGDIADHLPVGAGADLFLDFHPDRFEVETEPLEDVDGDALTEPNEAKQEMLGSDEVVIETVGFPARKSQYLLGARREVPHAFTSAGLTPRHRRIQRFPK